MTPGYFAAVVFISMIATIAAGLTLILGGAVLYVTCRRDAERGRKW